MYLAIDNRRLIRQPHFIEVTQPEADLVYTADRRPLVVPGGNYSQVNCTWGRNLSYQDVMAELARLRANRGVHAVTFEPSRGQRYLTINAYMGAPRRSHMGYTSCGKVVTAAFSIPFYQVDTPAWLWPCRFILQSTVAVLSPFTFNIAPAAGRFFAIEGWINNLGAGAGQTRIQMHNVERAVDYLSTEGDFVNAAPPNKRLQNAVLDTDLDFEGDQQINCNVTQIPAGGMSANAVVTFWAWLRHP